MAATVKVYCANGAGPTYTSVDSTDALSFKFGRDDNVISASTAPIPIPTSTGTHFSYIKWLTLYVTAGGGATSLLNRGVKLASSLATGLSIWFSGTTTYTQQNGTQGTAAANYPADSASNGATPANQTNITWVQMTTSNQGYDSATVAATNTTANGKYCATTIGVDFTFAGGGGPATLPNLIFQYDEQ